MTSQDRILAATQAAVAALALAVPAWVVTHPPAIPRVVKPVRPVAVVPPEVLPPVEPVQYQDLAPQDAQTFNASVPFSNAPNLPARPFRFYGGEDDRARARDCLAAAVWYEAGDDATGEKAVAQVVLNRVRHPAFPHTVCGVVFQGSDRHTGCQFTFTCDGALTRVPSPAAWDRARDIATAALSGTVYKPVGTATHYHTDWVVPYWSSSLDKIAEVHTHLFFRWTGWWGTPGAFRNRQAGAEPVVRQLAALSPLHGEASGSDQAAPGLLDGPLAATGTGAVTKAAGGDQDTFLAKLDGGAAPDSYRVLALATCGTRVRCKFMGWIDARLVPGSAVLSPQQISAMAFSYLRDREAGFERTLWNCTLVPSAEPGSCMRRQLTLSATPPLTAPPLPGARATPTPSPTPATELDGVRRRTPRPSPTPTPTATSAPRTRS